MSVATDRVPDVMVLGVGGILGEAWMLAVLAGLEEARGIDTRTCDTYLGSSAGSIVAATLASGNSPRDRLGDLPEQPAQPSAEAGGPSRLAALAGGALSAPVGMVAPFALRSTAAGGALVRRLALGRVPRGRRSLGGLGKAIDRAGARWDGRLRVAAVDLDAGRRVVFGEPGAPDAGVGEAVEASCAIPGVFRPVEIGGRSYVDGGAWSPTNMDAAPAERGQRVLCLNPTASLPGFGALSRSIARFEGLVLERRGASVVTVSPDRASGKAMGSNLMDGSGRDQVVAAGFDQGRALAV